MITLKTIARIKSDFPEKFGIPRQSNIVKGLRASIIFEEPFHNPDFFKGLEGFSHIWLIWGFSKSQAQGFSPTVRPPGLGGNKRMGIFATRSPFRPNPLGLSSVVLEGMETDPVLGPILHVSGADLMDGTPIYDIKPYLPYVDSHPEAVSDFSLPRAKLEVRLDPELLEGLDEESRSLLRQLLALDPRPAYQHDPQRVYGMAFRDMNIQFSVEGELLTVLSIEKTE